ncbi:hypothetical protein PsYK624_055250 [Phanerochaete sordida]|uniref:Uncharacterized protein n=1 Tax=Phanerochaete sordida TaxID=48140 RepID=A0A9P3LCC3_9APHY|nr:hypothetical protein PsYK624_055250 [Phanerochaete sordida]
MRPPPALGPMTPTGFCGQRPHLAAAEHGQRGGAPSPSPHNTSDADAACVVLGTFAPQRRRIYRLAGAVVHPKLLRSQPSLLSLTMRSFQLLAATALLAPSALAAAVPAVEYCANPRVVSTAYIGRNKDVLVTQTACDDVRAPVAAHALEARQANNVCGSTFDTFCFTPSGGGPDPNECHVITDALLYDSQNVGALFTLDPAQNTTTITMQYRSCESFMVNQAGVALTYCRTDWASILDNLAFNCQATQNAHGGLSVATNQEWFIQVQST